MLLTSIQTTEMISLLFFSSCIYQSMYVFILSLLQNALPSDDDDRDPDDPHKALDIDLDK